MKKLQKQMTKMFMIEIKDKLSISSERFLEIKTLISDSELYRFIIERISIQPGINTSTKTILATAILNLPEVREEIKRLVIMYTDQKIPAPNPYSDVEVTGLELERAQQAIEQYINEQSQRIDTRVQDDTDTLVRRLDSLARLLTVSSKYSTCLTLTIHEDALWISLNRDKEEPFDAVLSLIYERVDFLRTAIRTYKEEEYNTLWKTIAPELVARLIQFGGSTIPAENLTQDFAKLIYANGSQCSRLNENQKKMFTLFDKKVIFLHAQRDAENARQIGIQLTEFTSNHRSQSLFFPLPFMDNEPMFLRQFHAEQLMIHYFQKSGRLNPENPIRLGITKLCCNTCHEYLSEVPGVIKRGTHGLAYEGTLSLLTGEPARSNGLNPRITHPIASPPYSPVIHGISNLSPKKLLQIGERPLQSSASSNQTSPQRHKSPPSPSLFKNLLSRSHPFPFAATESSIIAMPALNSTPFTFFPNRKEEESGTGPTVDSAKTL